MMTAHQYLKLGVGKQSPVHLALTQGWEPPPAPGKEEKKLEFGVPVEVSGAAQGSVIALHGTMVMIEAPGGFRWESGWQAQNQLVFQNDHLSQSVHFTLNKPLFEKIQSAPVKLRVSFALTTFHNRQISRGIASDGRFPLPDVGACSIDPRFSFLWCRSPLRTPDLLLVQSSEPGPNCNIQENQATPPSVAVDPWDRND